MLAMSRSVQLSPSTVMTLPIFSFGLTNEGVRDASWLKVGYSQNPGGFVDGDLFELITWTSGPGDGEALRIGLGGEIVDGWPPTDPNPRASFTSTDVTAVPGSGFALDYAQWAALAKITLTLHGDGSLLCTWEDGTGRVILADTVPGSGSVPDLPYATIESVDSVGANQQEPGIYLGEWKVTGSGGAAPPYPFAQQQGALVTGPGAAGSVRIG